MLCHGHILTDFQFTNTSDLKMLSRTKPGPDLEELRSSGDQEAAETEVFRRAAPLSSRCTYCTTHHRGAASRHRAVHLCPILNIFITSKALRTQQQSLACSLQRSTSSGWRQPLTAFRLCRLHSANGSHSWDPRTHSLWGLATSLSHTHCSTLARLCFCFGQKISSYLWHTLDISRRCQWTFNLLTVTDRAARACRSRALHGRDADWNPVSPVPRAAPLPP